AVARVEALIERHVAVASALASGASRANLTAAIVDEFSAVSGLVRALAVLREVSPRSLDAVVAAGELASSRIVAAAFLERGMPAVWIDARRLVVTDAEHTAALPDLDATRARAQEVLTPAL